MANEAPSPPAEYTDIPGALLEVMYVGRQITCYPMSDGELAQLSNFNDAVALAASIASGVFGFGISVIYDAIKSGSADPARNIGYGIGFLCFVVVAVAVVVGVVSHRRSKSFLAAIKSQARQLPALPK